MRALFQPLTLALLAMSGSAASGTEIYRCQVQGLPPQFSQFPCASTKRSQADADSPGLSPGVLQELLTPGELQLLEIPALTSYERQSLEQAERRAARRQQSQRTSRARNAKTLRRQRALLADRCRKARQSLQELLARKRKGYPLSAARGLESRERALKKETTDSC